MKGLLTYLVHSSHFTVDNFRGGQYGEIRSQDLVRKVVSLDQGCILLLLRRVRALQQKMYRKYLIGRAHHQHKTKRTACTDLFKLKLEITVV